MADMSRAGPDAQRRQAQDQIADLEAQIKQGEAAGTDVSGLRVQLQQQQALLKSMPGASGTSSKTGGSKESSTKGSSTSKSDSDK